MCLPWWNFTGGAFAVFGCFVTLKCCGLNGLPLAALPLDAVFADVAVVPSVDLPPFATSPPLAAFPVCP
jgi:hypothetical protein